MGSYRKSSAQTVAVLAVFLEQPRTWQHGYSLSKATGLQSGTLYPILTRLEDRGYLESKWLEPVHVGRPPRHVCQLTPTGATYAREILSQTKRPQETLRPAGVKA